MPIETIQVLLVEDSPTDALIVTEELKQASGVRFVVTTVVRLTEASRLLREQSFGVVLLDLSLPDSEGFQTFLRLRDAAADVPVVVLSGRHDEELAVRAVQAGAQDYLVKGHFEEHVLLRSVRYAIERKRSEGVLSIQSRVLETVANAVVMTDAAGVILWVNAAFTTQTGYSSVEAVGRTPRILKSAHHEASFHVDLWATILSGQTWRGEFMNRRKDGSLYWAEETITPVQSTAGVTTHFIGVMNDVSDRKRGEAERERFFTVSLDLLCIVTFDGHFERVNAAFTRTLGFTEAELKSELLINFVHPDDRARTLAEIARLETGVRTLKFENRYRCRDGGIRWIAWTAVPYLEDRTLYAAGRDVTEAKLAETALRSSEERFRQVVESIREVFWMLDLEQNRLIYVSPSFDEIWGGSPAKLHESLDAFAATVHPDDRAGLLDTVRGNRGSVAGEDHFRIVRPDGAVRWIHLKAFPVRDDAGRVYRVAGVAEDITKSRQAEEALRVPSRVLESMVEGVHVSDANGVTLFSNPACDAMFGHERGALLGADLSRLSRMAAADGAALGAQIAAALKQSGQWTGEISSQKKDGTTLLTLAHITSLELEGRACAVALHEDITQKKRLELQALRTQRIESIGRLAGGIAHDMNNILAPIMMCVPMLRTKLEPKQAESFLHTIELSADRGAHLVKQLLFFSRGVEGERSTMRLKDSVEEIEDIVSQTFPKRLTIDTEIPAETWAVCADPTQIHQVLLNLCVNARDAMPGAGRLSIAVTNIVVDENYPGRLEGTSPGPYVQLSVADSGAGISAENIDRIFEPFFTTKEVGKSTGLGLSTVLGIVKSHGGFVTLQSKVGRGTTFRVHLPALSGSDLPPVERREIAPPRGEAQLVLVVDDEELIRDLAREHLLHHGYRVVTAENGAAAMAAFTQHADKIKLVMTDWDMPVMDGVSLIKLLLSINPRLRIIVSTGHQSAMRMENIPFNPEDPGAVSFLPKPFAANELLTTVYRLLQSTATRSPIPLKPPPS